MTKQHISESLDLPMLSASDALNLDEWGPVQTLDELVQYCLRMRPDVAARQRDSSLCVTPLIERLVVDGELRELRLVDGRHGALNVRVSTMSQRSLPRSAKPLTSVDATDERQNDPQGNLWRHDRDNGYSEEEQISRGIRFFAAAGWAFRIYSDAGVTGEFPNNDSTLIHKLLDKKAERFKRIFTQTLLDDTSLRRRSPEQVKAMRQHMEERVAEIRSLAAPPANERNLYETSYESEEKQGPKQSCRRGGRQHRKAFFRMGFTQLWEDVRADRIHILAASDRSRLARDADLETALLDLLLKHNVRLIGTIEDMSSIDVSNPVNKGVNYLIASINEARLSETAGHCFRGKVQAVESGKAMGLLPWWVQRRRDGMAELVPGCGDLVKRIIGLYLQGYGARAITTRLLHEGVTVAGKPLTDNQVRAAMFSDNLTGYRNYFGIFWRVMPVVIDDPDLLAEVSAKRAERRDQYGYITETTQWSDHLFTSLLRCACGKPMVWRLPSENAGPNAASGFYACNANRKKSNGGFHASISELQLGQFVGELLGKNPNVLNGMLARSLSGSSLAERTASRALLEEKLSEAMADLESAKGDVYHKACLSASAFGLEPETDRFADAVASLTRGALASREKEIEIAKAEIARLQVDVSRDRRTEALAIALEQIGEWEALDIATRNRLMRSIFEKIVVYPRRRENCIEFRLVGVATSFRVYLERGRYGTVVFPTVGEWIRQMTLSGDSSRRPCIEPQMNTKTMRSFYGFLRKERGDDCRARALAAAILAVGYPPARLRTTRQYMERFLLKNGASEEMMGFFSALWEEFFHLERERLIRKEAIVREKW